MTTANELITRALRLINVPGRGNSLDAEDLTAGFDTLRDILNTRAIDAFFQPGIRRQFFQLTASQANYSYGPRGQLDTQAGFEEPAPLAIEDAYIRGGGQIITNEKVTQPRFTSATGWILGTGWTISNREATLAAGNSGETLTQTLALEAGVTYNVLASMTHIASSVTLDVSDGAGSVLSIVLDTTDVFEFSITSTTAGGSITVTADDALSNVNFSRLSVLQEGLQPTSLVEGVGYDYALRKADQMNYNRFANKGSGGRPDRYLFSRSYPLAEIRFDTTPLAGDILVVDCLVNTTDITDVNDTLKLNPEAERYLRYQVADEMAGEYGKELSQSQLRTKDEAYDLMAAANTRYNKLATDSGLLMSRGSYNINRGDN